MNITISVDCTPSEAREFFGLPDIKDMQAQVMSEMQKQMTKGLGGMAAEDLMKLWMPGPMIGLDQFQEMLRKFSGGGQA
ncbi:DUF6489 family protein [Actibacterium sp. XHP0104]|uniref:DUF6489 family protein n=1 Tax=Actibacterium sp. XHP0104 TaxID=2984335 RepID=UPI0021E97E99|nr:DUF6489 family protein [Actibacterium sp. XHP0104]MCV2881466.1 DUF6489 family protein [Actibacterium sp. XHP0104]